MNRFLSAAYLLLLFIILAYVFVSAPPPLTVSQAEENSTLLPVSELFRILQAENATARGLYTREIVGSGQIAGLSFSESWRLEEVQAGPLPALFLRETAAHLNDFLPNLTLFLGSDLPLEDSNRFEGTQVDYFLNIRQTSESQFFYMSDVERYVGMFPDIAQAQPCVTCHNEHPNAPKTDWALGDIMGATTWMYPEEQVSLEEALTIVDALHQSIALTYDDFLLEVEGFENVPTIGDQWPRDGYYLPSRDIFMAEFRRLSSVNTLNSLIHAAND
jgi:adenylate cyclase